LKLYVEPKLAGVRSPYDKLLILKITILQKYYRLSDKQVDNRTLFRLFLGLEIGDKVH